MISSINDCAGNDAESVSRANLDWDRPAIKAPETAAVRIARIAAATRASTAVKASDRRNELVFRAHRMKHAPITPPLLLSSLYDADLRCRRLTGRGGRIRPRQRPGR